MKFDDITDDEYGTWTQVCENHSTWIGFRQLTDIPVGQLTCGAKGCTDEAQYYAEFRGNI